MAERELIPVEVVYAKPCEQRVLAVQVPPGTTVVEAVRCSGITRFFPEIDPETADLGIYGVPITDPQRVLAPHERIEIYRPLQTDPKARRRERAAAQRRGGRVTR